MPSPLRNGDLTPHHHFFSTASERRLRRLNALIILLRFATFCFSLAAAIFTVANTARSGGSTSWAHFETFRFMLTASAIVAVYSFFEMGVSAWEILRSTTPLPEPVQLWFDFGHDQVFAYLLLSAAAAAAREARGLSRGRTCTDDSAFCVQAYFSVALGFVGFAFLAVSALLSGYRLACFTVTGTRYHL